SQPSPDVVGQVALHLDEHVASAANRLQLARRLRWDVDRRDIRLPRRLAQLPGIPLVVLDPAFANAQQAHQRPRYYPHLMSGGERRVGDLERLRARLHHDPAGRPGLDELGQLPSRVLAFLDDGSVRLTDADLRFLAPQIDGSMMHGCPPRYALRARFHL